MREDARLPRLLATFLDDVLRVQCTKLSEEETDELLDKVVGLFRYLFNKDVFESFYKVLLAKRLLAQRTASDDFETAMIGKLKVECGHQFTAKLEGMFKDARQSAKLEAEFRERVGGEAERPLRGWSSSRWC